MSEWAYQARRRNLARLERPRTHADTRRLELEIALAAQSGETYRAMARRLGLKSHAHCWRVVRRYRTGQIPMLPRSAPELAAMRDSLDRDSASRPVLPWWLVRAWESREEIWGCILLTQEQKVQAAAEFDRKYGQRCETANERASGFADRSDERWA